VVKYCELLSEGQSPQHAAEDALASRVATRSAGTRKKTEMKKSRNGKISYYHQMLAGCLVHPDRKEVIPVFPEPIIQQDGTTKNDCERNAPAGSSDTFAASIQNCPLLSSKMP